MKNIVRYIAAPIMAFSMVACESELDRLWNNPNVYTPEQSEICSGLFTHMQKTRFWQKDYGEWYWMLGNGSIPVMIQVTGGIEPYVQQNDAKEWILSQSPINSNYLNINYPDPTRAPGASTNSNDRNRFNQFYTDLANYPLIRDVVAGMSGSELADNQIYLKLATILKDVVALQTVDLFNKIPYTNAFKGSDASNPVFFASYDDPKEIYTSVLAEYKSIAAELPTIYAGMSETAKTVFAKQDIFFKGDVDKWVRYINAQLLRSSVRVSSVMPEAVQNIAAIADKLPESDYTFPARMVNDCYWGRGTVSGAELFPRGLADRFWRTTIPDNIMERMNKDGQPKYTPGVDDPRMPVIGMGFTPDGKADNIEFYGTSGNWDRNNSVLLGTFPGEKRRMNIFPQNDPAHAVAINDINSIDYIGGSDDAVQSCPWTFYNPRTYICSDDFHFNIETRSEVELFLAEACLKGWISGDAATHVKNAVKYSVDFWYEMNHRGSDKLMTYYEDKPYTDLARAILQPANPGGDAYAQTIADEFNAAASEDAKMEIIMQQKYIHLNLIGVYELFAEIRRTRHPKIEPITATGTAAAIANAKMILERVPYPSSEATNNKDEFAKVAAESNWTSPIFWANDRASYFLDSAIKPAQ